MPLLLQQYSRRASRDVRGAMALALRRILESLWFDGGTAPFQFSQVFEEWPSFASKYIPPAACVQPGAWTYDSSNLVPTLMEDTWEPFGQQGFGLYKLTEIAATFELFVRTSTVGERNAIALGLETAFVMPNILMNIWQGARNAVLVDLPEYYGLPARFSLLSARMLDSEDAAIREHRDLIFTISGQAPQVAVGPVFPLNMTIHYACNDI